MHVAELVEIGKIAFREVPRPGPGKGEILLRTRAVGLCGTDLKAYLRGHPYFAPPCVLGHEFTGTIAALGDGVDGWRRGETVVVAPYVECGVCSLCRRGLGELCRDKAFVAGALQEYLLLPREIVEKATFRLPATVDTATGTLAEPLACVMNGIERAAIRPEDRVLVVGGGPMGALLATVARSITTRVIVSEPAPARIAALRALGLTVINPSGESVPDRLAQEFEAPEADKVLIAVGVRAVAEEAISWTATGGNALLFGGLPKSEQLTIDPFAIHYREVGLVGSFGFRLDHFRVAVDWLAEHPERAVSLVTDRVPFENVEAGFALAQRAEGLKTVVTFGDCDET